MNNFNTITPFRDLGAFKFFLCFIPDLRCLIKSHPYPHICSQYKAQVFLWEIQSYLVILLVLAFLLPSDLIKTLELYCTYVRLIIASTEEINQWEILLEAMCQTFRYCYYDKLWQYPVGNIS